MATYAEPITERRVTPRRVETPAPVPGPDQWRFLVPIGRALFVAIFLVSGLRHFSAEYVGFATQQGVPLASVLVPLAGAMALLGGFSVLLGYRARIGAWLLVAFLIPVTFAMHNFWAITDPAMKAIQQAAFMKNVAMMGGALLIAWFGSGPMSLDARRRYPG